MGVTTVDPTLDWEGKIRATTDTNIGGVFNTVLPVAPLMRARKAGQIAVVSSIAGIVTLPGSYAYGASKAHLNSFVAGMRADLNKDNVGVTTICPGFVRSALTEDRHNASKFGLPFFMETDAAAALIAKGLEEDVGILVFPFPMHLLGWVLRVLPANVTTLLYEVLEKYWVAGNNPQ